MKIFPTALTILLGTGLLSGQEVSVDSGSLNIREEFTRTLHFSSGDPGPISSAWSDREGKVLTAKNCPVFEFVLSGNIVKATDPVWVFREHSVREMGNRGKEVTAVFHGARGAADGLVVTLVQQAFPGTALIREQLRLSVSPGKSFRLSKIEDKLHFEFPRYDLKRNDPAKATEIRIATWQRKPITFLDRKGKPSTRGNHMYFPVVETGPLQKDNIKGPISFVNLGGHTWFTAYEHASQDSTAGLSKNNKGEAESVFRDPLQSISGEFDFKISKDDFRFLGIDRQAGENSVRVAVTAERGAYLDGELIDEKHPYETVWVASGFHRGHDLEIGKALLRDYLLNWICERPASRVPEFYYNTWGMQRSRGKRLGGTELRDSLNYVRVFAEIERAHELGVKLFVLDDGWQNKFGDWTPNSERFPDGLAPIRKALEERGMKMGVWFSPLCIDPTSERYKKYPQWVILDSKENPVGSQYNYPVFDMVSRFYDLFVADCKALIDQGVRFMKWDAINGVYSTLAGLEHGSSEYSKAERRARYEYLLPIYIVRAMEELCEYEPELVIEVDLTEARRVMIGLAPLSQGKFFFMNNGASGYEDFSTFRAKSIRTIPNEYAGIIPLELFTFANYPHASEGARDYNTSTSLVAGHGFWGDLELVEAADRKWTGAQVARSLRVLPHIVETRPEVIGKVGSTPEIYTIVNREKAAGQVIAFSAGKVEREHRVTLESHNLLGVLGHAYDLKEPELVLPLSFPEGESTRAAFVIPNEGAGVSVRASSRPLSEVNWSPDTKTLTYVSLEPGRQVVHWTGSAPKVEEGRLISTVKGEGGSIVLLLETKQPGGKVVVRGE